MSSQNDSISGDDVAQIMKRLGQIQRGELEGTSEAIEEAKEPGLNPNQLAVVEKYAGEGRVTVDESTTPNLAEKVKAGAELPWTFVLDGVQFVMKAGCGAGGNPSEWFWFEEGHHFTYYKYDDQENEIRIEERDD